MKPDTIVLTSGGLDSTVLLYYMASQGAKNILGVSFDYGSLHNERERAALVQIADVLAESPVFVGKTFNFLAVKLTPIFSGGHSALMGDIPVPEATYAEASKIPGEAVTVVPFRNANLLSAAVTIAEVNGASVVASAQHASDHEGWAYPDCSPEFLGSFASATYVGTMQRVRFRYPFVWMYKANIVQLGYALGVPFELTYSCYRGGDLHCGNCPTCVERKQAFAASHTEDPTNYEV